MKKLKIDDIRIDGGTQCRVVIDQPTVYSYVELMKDGEEFPPLETVYDGSTHWLVDGFHRWHAHKILGAKEVSVVYKPGGHDDAVIAALKANAKHGKTLTNADKANKVTMALAIPAFAEKSDYEIAKLCGVSRPFVASVRDPEVKAKQEVNRIKSAVKKAKELGATIEDETGKPIHKGETPTNPFTTDPQSGSVPDEAELKAMELAQQADMEAMEKLLDSDEPLKVAHEEIKRLNHLNAQLEVRINALMNEKNEAIKECKKLQKQLDKLKKEK